jgi:hypothetical protein
MDSDWINLNGLWEWEPATGINGTASTPPPFGKTLARSILVPFPAESCLSGIGGDNHEYQWYRTTFNCTSQGGGGGNCEHETAALHFGAVDWHTKVYLNKQLLGTHSGGYDGFSFTLAPGENDQPNGMLSGENELLVFVYDPSEHGSQPFGKQRAASIAAPGTDGNRYTPSSGIWQSVWLEPTLPPTFITDLAISANLTTVTVHVSSFCRQDTTGITVFASASSAPGQVVATSHAFGACMAGNCAMPTSAVFHSRGG